MTTTTTDRVAGPSGSAAIKIPCVVSTISNITLSGTQTIDGIAVVADNRVLVKNQTDAVDNGIWVVGSSSWQRAKDFDGPRDIVKGTAVYVFAGNTQEAGMWRLTTDAPVIGTSELTFEVDTVISVSGDVVGPTSTTNNNFAIFSGTTGKVLKDSSINSSSFDAAGAASTAVSSHVSDSDPHTQYLKKSNNLSDLVSTATARSNLGLGSAATTASTAYATSTQGAKADTALQSGDIGTTVKIDTTMFTTNTIDTDTTLAASSDTRIPTQKAIKTYVDAVSSGTTPRIACRVATTAALTVTYSNGASGVGATLTNAGTQAAIAIDGVTLSSADRVLVKDQASPAQNGIYTVTTLGSGATNWVLTRATDFDAASSAEVSANALVSISAGNTLAGNAYFESGAGPFTIGTTAITFSLFSSAANLLAGDGLGKLGNTLSVDSTVARQTTTTKGDLLTRTSLTDARLPVGTNGQYLVANSTTSTGLQWIFGVDYDIKSYFGAVGDGVADDTSAFSAAFDYSIANGVSIHLGSGKYRITSALTKTYTYTSNYDITRPLFRGNAGTCQILYDGVSAPSSFMITLQRAETVDGAGLHAHSIIEGITFAPINTSKNGYIGGLKLIKFAYLSCRDLWFHHLSYALYLDQVISSLFTTINCRSNQYGVYSIGAPSSTQTGDIYSNNANIFINCEMGLNSIGGFTSIDGSFTYTGGAIEVNGTGGSAGSGYGMKIIPTHTGGPIAFNVKTYFEGNGTTGDLGSNPSTADIWIVHGNTNDNMTYNLTESNFNRLSSNYAPHAIYIEKSATTACHVNATNAHFTNYSGYTASANRKYIKYVDTGGGVNNINFTTLGNFYQQSIEQPDFILGTVIRPGTVASYLRIKSYGALVYQSGAQSISTSTATALVFDSVDYNDAGIFSLSNPTRLVVPAGATRIELEGNVRYSPEGTANTNWQLFVRKNGASFAGVPYQQHFNAGGTYSHTLNISSPMLNVTGGDYLELFTQQNTPGSVNTDTSLFGSTWFAMRIIE